MDSWPPVRELPAPLVTSNVVLEPLAPKHAEVDFVAIMSCRARLREELQWRGWPPDTFTLEQNRADLARHFDEFEAGVAFAYTLLVPDRSRCVGCVYLERSESCDARLAFWVIDELLSRETAIVGDVLAWFHEEWGLSRIAIPLRESNSRALAGVVDRLTEFEAGDEFADHRVFISQWDGF